MDKDNLMEKIKNRNISVAVVGLGYVGLPLAIEKARAGYRTIGFDVQEKKVKLVNSGINYIDDVVDDDLAELVKSGRLSATIDYSFIGDSDFIAICVPTPLDDHQQPDTQYVEQSGACIAKYLSRGSIVVLESTTYPGTTEGLLRRILEEGSGLECGEDFYLGFSPERVDPGNLRYNTKNTPKVVSGIGKDATEVIAYMYRQVLQGDIHEVSSPMVAEMEKLLENTYRNINIALINEISMLCHRMGINVWEVIDAAKSKPYGFQAFYPGVGVGGHCIPLDPYYLSWKAREFRFHTSMIETSAMINDQMPDYCVERCAEILNRWKKALNGSKILVLGVAYKQDVSDYRESPVLRMIDLLEDRGADVSYFDPWVEKYVHRGKEHTSISKLDPVLLSLSDIVVVATSHTNVDYEFVQQNARFVFDAKNAMKNVRERDNIELL